MKFLALTAGCSRGAQAEPLDKSAVRGWRNVMIPFVILNFALMLRRILSGLQSLSASLPAAFAPITYSGASKLLEYLDIIPGEPACRRKHAGDIRRGCVLLC